VSADEFENQDPAPIPAYERTWRHPAEIADAARTDFLATQPRISHRLTAFAAAISLVASGAVLAIAIPKGISSYREDATEVLQIFPSSTVSGVKNFSPREMAIIKSDTGTTSAFSLGNGVWIAASDDIAASTSLWVTSETGQDAPARVVAKDSATGLALVHCEDKSAWGTAPDLSHLINPNQISDWSLYRIVDTATSETFDAQPSLSTNNDSADMPINSTDAIHGLATVRDAQGQLVGIVVRRHHSAWILNKNAIINMFPTVMR
jgi:S1-C subfamily serine protease